MAEGLKRNYEDMVVKKNGSPNIEDPTKRKTKGQRSNQRPTYVGLGLGFDRWCGRPSVARTWAWSQNPVPYDCRWSIFNSSRYQA